MPDSLFIMKKGVFICVIAVLVHVGSEYTASEMVWVKDVTKRFQKEKRTFGDLDLPKELRFHLMHGSNALTLNLKRNYEIDPNADVYIVRKLKDGGSYLEKTRNLEKEDVAYYQDIENGAFMTVGCARRSKGQCDRVLNGNIRTGGRDYDLRLAETRFRSRNFWGVPDLLGKQYFLRDQENIQKEMFVENKDAGNINEKNKEQELIDLRCFQHRQSKQNHSPSVDTLLTSKNLKGFNYRENNGEKSYKYDIRDKTSHTYDVEVAAVIDKGIWELFWSLVQHSNDTIREEKVQTAIRKFYAHIFNGVNLRYKGLKDHGIEIRVTLRHFVIFQNDSDFQHKDSEVIIAKGMKYIDISKYLNDLSDWDLKNSRRHPSYDHAMLFSRYDFFDKDMRNSGANGFAWPGMVCELGKRTSVVKASDYFMTVGTATHELAHNLGAVHDGDEGAEDCRSEDFFIMSKTPPQFSLDKPYSRNPWIFSECTVRAFKNTLKDKDCVKTKGVIYDKTEWERVTKKLPGEKYSNNQQCQLILGDKSTYCGEVLSHICLFMECVDPQTGRCHKKYFSAARGTTCGLNMLQNNVNHAKQI